MARANKKTERNAEIIEALYEMSAAKVALKFGISRQRVEQIIRENGGYQPGMIRFKQAVVLVEQKEENYEQQNDRHNRNL